MWNGSIFSTRSSEPSVVWDNQPGGTVVDKYKDPITSIEYVVVVFENSPNTRYTYFA